MKRFSTGLRIIAGVLLLPVAACGIRSGPDSPDKQEVPGVTPVRSSLQQPSKAYRSDCICMEEAMGKRPLSIDGGGRFLRPTEAITVGGGEYDAQRYHIAKISITDTPSEHHADDYFWTSHWYNVSAQFIEGGGMVVAGSYNLLDYSEFRPSRAVAMTSDGLPPELPSEDYLLSRAIVYVDRANVPLVTNDDFPPDSASPSGSSGATDENGNPCTPTTCGAPAFSFGGVPQDDPGPTGKLKVPMAKLGMMPGGMPLPNDNSEWSKYMPMITVLVTWIAAGTCFGGPIALLFDIANMHQHFRKAMIGPFDANPPGSQLTDQQYRDGQVTVNLIAGLVNWGTMFVTWGIAKSSCTGWQAWLSSQLWVPIWGSICGWLLSWVTWTDTLSAAMVLKVQVFIMGYVGFWIGIETLYNMIVGIPNCRTRELARPDAAPQMIRIDNVVTSRDPLTGRVQVTLRGANLNFVETVFLTDAANQEEYEIPTPVRPDQQCNELWVVVPDTVPQHATNRIKVIAEGHVPGLGKIEATNQPTFLNDPNQIDQPNYPQGPCGSSGILPLGGPGGGGPGNPGGGGGGGGGGGLGGGD